MTIDKQSPLHWTHIDVDRYEDRPLWFHLRGLSQMASGYGSRLVSARVAVLSDGRKRRVYVTQWSNAGTAWIVVDKVIRLVRG